MQRWDACQFSTTYYINVGSTGAAEDAGTASFSAAYGNDPRNDVGSTDDARNDAPSTYSNDALSTQHKKDQQKQQPNSHH